MSVELQSSRSSKTNSVNPDETARYFILRIRIHPECQSKFKIKKIKSRISNDENPDGTVRYRLIWIKIVCQAICIHLQVVSSVFTVDKAVCIYLQRGWSGGAKVSCILRHRGIQLILAYKRPAILEQVRVEGDVFVFLLFLHFHSCSSFFLSFISSSISFLPFSGRRHKMTRKG